jgi:hypothetical protein
MQAIANLSVVGWPSQEAMDVGFDFFLSSNEVLLCKGPLPVQYVEAVTRDQLPEEWQQMESQQ